MVLLPIPMAGLPSKMRDGLSQAAVAIQSERESRVNDAHQIAIDTIGQATGATGTD